MLDESASTRRGSRLRILFVTADKFPPFRPAAKAIFADGLSASGHDVDWLIQAADERTAEGPRHYKRGVAFVAATNGGSSRLARLRKYWAALRNDWHVFRLLREHEYSLVQIKDKYVGAERSGADRMERRGQRPARAAGDRPARVQHRDHREHDAKARTGRQAVPVRGDEQQDARRQQQAAECEYDQRQAPALHIAPMGFFPGANALRRSRIEQTRRQPAVQRRLPVIAHAANFFSMAS
jgi:hypothetical protein